MHAGGFTARTSGPTGDPHHRKRRSRTRASRRRRMPQAPARNGDSNDSGRDRRARKDTRTKPCALRTFSATRAGIGHATKCAPLLPLPIASLTVRELILHTSARGGGSGLVETSDTASLQRLTAFAHRAENRAGSVEIQT